ncbi:threonine aldolase family protein [Candidatus Latescibacterota bacterium]
MTKGFASDNHAGVHPEVLAAMAAVNEGHVHSYGDDPYTEGATARTREHFGDDSEAYFVFNGTAANVLSAAAVCRPYHAVICADTAHFHHDECGASERFVGCRVLAVPANERGKLTPEALRAIPGGHAEPHQNIPRMVSITQSTELGTVYSLKETRAVADCVHEQGLVLHMDGARLANAAVGLGVSLRELTGDVGVDVLSFGGTKNGIMMGEAVVFFDRELAADFPYIRKQALQLASKMRFVSAQFEALLTDDLWARSARHANAMARLLADEVRGVPGVAITQPVEANAVFARLPSESIPALQEEFFFYVWDEDTGEVRLMASFDTTEEDVRGFAAAVRRIVA